MNGKPNHGTSWDEEYGKIILWKAVSIATVKPPAKNPEGEIAYTPYLKVVGMKGLLL